MQAGTDFALTRENLGAYLTGSLSGETAKKIEPLVSRLKREDVAKPTIYIGTGTCGLGAGAGKTLEAIKSYLSKKNIDADVIQVGCIGLCAEEPMVDFQLPGRTRISFRKITEDKVPQLMDAMLACNVPEDLACFQFRSKMLKGWNNVKYMDEHPFFASQTRCVLAGCGIVDPTNIWEYIAWDGYRAFAKTIYDKTRQEVCDMVEKSGLRGRGGGGFNTGTKWKLALQQEADQKYMICNADEGDPGAFMDRAVIEGDPHRMIEGLAIAAYAIGASKAYVYIRAEYPLAIKHLQQAIKQAKEIGLLGENIMDSGFDLEIKIKMGAGAFVCGEETALINSIEGKRGMPRPRPPYPSVKGLFGKPTAINNVETLANVPTLVRNGEGWFSSIGTATSKGTKVFALSGNISNTGLVEVAMGTILRKIIFEIGGGIPNGRQFKSVQIGGPSGGCMPTPLLDTEIDYESLKSAGAMMGSGGMVVMDDATCMVDVAKYFMDFIQRESCGKCIPCREGTRRMLEILTMITKGRKGEHGADALERFQGITQLERLAEVIKDTSLCGLGNSSPNPILSTLRWFRHEYEAHIYERRCPAGVCPELLVYSIGASKCTGCTLCAKNCPAASIMGAPKSPHYIITDKCISCGTCFMVCRFGAISKS